MIKFCVQWIGWKDSCTAFPFIMGWCMA